MTDRWERLGYVCNPHSLMEGTEALCPHATILNHRWLPGTRSRLLSVKPNEWMHLSPFYTRTHGEKKNLAADWLQVHFGSWPRLSFLMCFRKITYRTFNCSMLQRGCKQNVNESHWTWYRIVTLVKLTGLWGSIVLKH